MQQVAQSSQVGVAAGVRVPRASQRGAFVVNLDSSGTPVALNEPRHPELKSYTFFISRRREDGRERFRLHMGYFETQQDAEAMLELVRDIYPGAWAGLAPGRKAPEAAAVSVTIAAAVTEAAAPVAPAAPMDAPAGAALSAGFAAPTPITAVPASASAPRPEPTFALPPTLSEPLSLSLQAPDEHQAAVQSLDSVRAAIASLEDASQAPTLSSTQTLKLLEEPLDLAPTLAGALPKPVQAPVSTLAPDAVAAYAVQLRWAAQPIGISELPPLAIFDAYMLYRAKGRQQNGYWHALRLGFFHDEMAAGQVASYIRSEFADATVVPVGAAERDKALSVAARNAGSDAASRAQAAAQAASTEVTGQFKLIEESTPRPVDHGRLEMMLTADGANVPGKTAAKQTPEPGTDRRGQSGAKTRRPPANLEETLDVLGAGSLKLASGKGEMLDASGVRRMRHAAERKTPQRSSLSRLFDRLAERIGGGR